MAKCRSRKMAGRLLLDTGGVSLQARTEGQIERN